jgi:hypothetical protein
MAQANFGWVVKVRAEALKTSERSLRTAAYDRAAFLAPIAGDSTFRCLYLVESVPLAAGDLETFRTKTFAQIVPG